MELRHLKYFVAVAEARSFVRAAGRLRVAQPSLSRQIRDLEQELGVKLFDRLPRGTRLTRAGEAFLEDARRTLDSASSAVATARRVVGTETLTLAHGDMDVYTPEPLALVAAVRPHSPQTPARGGPAGAAAATGGRFCGAGGGGGGCGQLRRKRKGGGGESPRWCPPLSRHRRFPCGWRWCGAAISRRRW